MTTSNLTPKARVVDALLIEKRGYGLAEAVRRARREGASWRDLAMEISRVTGEPISGMTLLSWSDLHGWEAEDGSTARTSA